ncbi:hypothetical protein Tco_0485300 [Tanacetum coccineum]
MIEADEQLAARLQAEEQEQFSIEEKSRMLVEMISGRKKLFAAQRAVEKISKPPTKTQIRNRMCAYLKKMGGYKHNQLKGRSYEEIQKLFDKAYKQVNSFVPIDSEVVKSSETRTEESLKEQEMSLNLINQRNRRMGYFKLIRADGSSKRYSSMIKMLQDIDKEDLETLWKFVKAKHGNTRPEEDYERVL